MSTKRTAKLAPKPQQGVPPFHRPKSEKRQGFLRLLKSPFNESAVAELR